MTLGIDTISQIEDQQVLKELLLESEFYQLASLKHHLEAMLGLEGIVRSMTPPSPPRSQSPTNRSSSALRSGYAKMKSIVPNTLQSYM